VIGSLEDLMVLSVEAAKQVAVFIVVRFLQDVVSLVYTNTDCTALIEIHAEILIFNFLR